MSKTAFLVFAIALGLLAGCAPVRYYQAFTEKEPTERKPTPIVARGERAPRHEDVSDLGGGLHLARIQGKDGDALGVVDQRNRVVIPITYQRIDKLDDDRFNVIGSNNVSTFDRQGDERSALTFEEKLYYRNGQAIAWIKPRGGWLANSVGVIDLYGRTIVPFEYSNIVRSATDAHPEVNWYLVHQGRRWGLLDMQGQVVLPPVYYEISSNREINGLDAGWVRVSVEKHKFVAINLVTGLRMSRPDGEFYGQTVGYRTLQNPEPEELNQFERMKYREAHPARYRLELFDVHGKAVYDQGDLASMSDLAGILVVERDSRFALLNVKGQPLSDFRFSEIKSYGGGQALVVLGNRTVCIDGADPAHTVRPPEDCDRATRKSNSTQSRGGSTGAPAVYPRYGGE